MKLDLVAEDSLDPFERRGYVHVYIYTYVGSTIINYSHPVIMLIVQLLCVPLANSL